VERRYQVFVSSTYEDLKKERAEVLRVLLEVDCIPAGMELFPAAGQKAWSLIKSLIDQCDFFLLIVAGRYGSTDSRGIGYIEKEFQYAHKKGKPILAFLHGCRGKIPNDKCDQCLGAKRRLDKFCAEIRKLKHCKSWSTPDNLGKVVASSMHMLIKNTTVGGWVRGVDGIGHEEQNDLLSINARTQLRTIPGRGSRTPPTSSLLLGSTSLAGQCCSETLDPFASNYKERLRLYKIFLSPAARVVATCTWDRVLLAIGGATGLGRSYAPEVEAARALSGLLLPNVPKRIVQSELFNGVLIDKQCVQTVAHHLVACGVVDVKAFDTYYRRGRYWRLTESGQKRYAILKDHVIS